MIKRALTLISYAVTTVAIVVTTILLVELAQGYSYNLKTGEYGINGILSLNSVPSSAALIVNGKDSHHVTPYRNTLKTGSYSLELRKKGFRTWQKQVDIIPFQVLSLESVFLYPNTIAAQDLTGPKIITNFVASRDRRHFAYLVSDSSSSVWVLDTNHGPGTKVFEAAVAGADHPAETIGDVSWSDDGSHLLVQTRVGDVATYYLVDANGGSVVNLTDLFKLDFTGLRFSSFDWRQLYWNNPTEGLRRLNFSDKTTSAVLADKVLGFTFDGDRIIYIHTTALGQAVWSMDRNGNGQKQLIESLGSSSGYQMIYANYHGRDALAILPQGSSTLTAYFDIFSANPVSKVVSKNAAQFSFSDNGRYLAYYSGKSFGEYDLEKNALIQSQPLSTPLTCLNWFDPEHLVVCREHEIDVTELDGANLVKVSDVVASMPAFGGSDLRHIYNVIPASQGRTAIYGYQVRQ